MGIIHHNEVNRNSILEAARQYHNRGWSVIPISPQDKKPARGWKQYQKQRPCEKELSDWFGEGSPYNLGIVCGAVSGRLAVMDFDARGAYTKWKDKHRALAKECPTAKTGRPSGRHVYFRMPEGLDLGTCVKTDYGQLQVERHFVVAPPSIHPNGKPYQWSIPPAGQPPELDPFEAGFLPPDKYPQTHRETASVSLCGCVDDIGHAIQEAISQTLPRQEGERHDCIWNLARRVRAIGDFRNDELVDVIREWHRRALPNIKTKSFDVSRMDFLEACSNVKFPAGQGSQVLDEVARIAWEKPFPAAAEKYDHKPLHRLVALCAELQRQHGEGEFFLSCREAGRLVGVPYREASSLLRGLVADQVLVVTKKPPRASGKAYRYRFTGEM